MRSITLPPSSPATRPSAKVAAKPTAKPARARAPGRSLADVALIGAGLASAAASVVFAATMVARGDHAPLVNGMQYLAIFGQPRLRVASSAPSGGEPGKAIDYNPTGSIFRSSADDGSTDDPYRLVAVEPGMAWLRNSTEMRVVKPGDIAPGIGRIAAIVMRNGRWTLVDDSGATLLVAEPPKGAAGSGDPFARRMIFGDGN